MSERINGWGDWLRRRYERQRFEEYQFAPYHVMRGARYLLKQRFGRREYPEEGVREYRARPGLSGWDSGRDDLHDPIRIVAVGDLLWQPEPLADYIAPSLRAWLRGTDLLLANLETPVTAAQPHKVRLPLFEYSAIPGILDPLSSLEGIGNLALSVVNNHALDQGDEGLLSTLREVRRIGGVPLGVTSGQDAASTVLEVKGFTVGLTAWASHLNRPTRLAGTKLGLNLARGLTDVRHPQDIETVEQDVARLRSEGAELVVMGLHWGYEHESIPDPLQRRVARRLVSGGPTLIAGHHPHLAQPIDLIDADAPGASPSAVAYSLGNFVSDMQRRDWSLGLAIDARFARHASGVALQSYTVQPLFIWTTPAGCFVDLFEPEALRCSLPPALDELIDGVGRRWDLLRSGKIVDDRRPAARRLA